MWHPTELMELVELADLVYICSQGNRAAPHARDLVRFFLEEPGDRPVFWRCEDDPVTL